MNFVLLQMTIRETVDLTKEYVISYMFGIGVEPAVDKDGVVSYIWNKDGFKCGMTMIMLLEIKSIITAKIDNRRWVLGAPPLQS